MQRQRGRGARGSRSQLMNIGARRKRSARTGQHDRIDAWITDGMLECGHEPKSNGVAETVHRRITQVQDRHPVTHLILDRVKESLQGRACGRASIARGPLVPSQPHLHG